MCQRTQTALPCEAPSVGRARSWVRDQLAAVYDALGYLTDDIALVVSELVTNCVSTEAHRFTLVVEAHHTTVRIAATDNAPGVPTKRRPPPDALHGRGLVIVDALSTRWGVTPANDGKTVWAEFPAPGGIRPTFHCTLAG